MGFERCGMSKERNTRKVRTLGEFTKDPKDPTCEIIFLWHVILWEERASEVVHEEESKARDRDRCHTTGKDIAKIE
jgi:hypothetical protein